MGEAREQVEQAAQEAAYDPGSVGPAHSLEWLFTRSGIPQDVKERFWIWGDIKSQRLSNLQNVENANTILSQLDYDIQLYFIEKFKKGEDVEPKTVSWLNQLKALVRLNILASLGERDMELITKTKGEYTTKSEVEQRVKEPEE